MPSRPPTFKPDYAPPPGTYSALRSKFVPWQRWYKLQRWKNMRWVQLMKDPLCAECQRGTPSRVTTANTVHHVVPHKGNATLFWDAANLESVCKSCHDRVIQSRERGGVK